MLFVKRNRVSPTSPVGQGNADLGMTPEDLERQESIGSPSKLTAPSLTDRTPADGTVAWSVNENKGTLPMAFPAAPDGGRLGELRPGSSLRLGSSLSLGRLGACQRRHPQRRFGRTLAAMKTSSLHPSLRDSVPRMDPAKLSCCGAFRYRTSQRWKRAKQNWREFWSDAELFRGSLKTVEGRFGSAVSAYFRFLRWLLILNAFIFVIAFVFIALPHLIFATPDTTNSTVTAVNETCTPYVVGVSNDTAERVLDFFQGTGWMEQRFLFYGHYDDSSLVIGTFSGQQHSYNLPLAYILVIICVCALSLVLMVRHTSKGLRAYMMQKSSKQEAVFCGLVFSSWDYGLTQPQAVTLKHASLYTEIMSQLVENEVEKKHLARTCCTKCQLYTARLVINVLVVAILGAAGYLIYYATNESLKFRRREDYETIDLFLRLLMEYVPSITIAALNFIAPVFFQKLVQGEGYKPETELNWTLFRTVFLRLASLAVLVGTLYYEITCNDCDEIQCWETYAGQQFYKLVIMDFLINIAVVFLVDFPRRLVVTKCECKLTRLVGRAEFQLPTNVLALVYTQTLCWLGVMFSPLIPGMVLVESFVIFYAKRITCVYNYVPASRPFRAARARTFFMAVLISAFLLCCVPLGFVIWKMTPSCNCGPFRGLDTMLTVFTAEVDTWPKFIKSVIDFMTSGGFIVPLFVILILLIYFCSSMANAHKENAAIFQHQLIVEAHEERYRQVGSHP